MFDSTMCFSPHISNITCKATRSLNFVKRNHKCASNTKSLAYTSLVRPTLEYASPAWDPFLNKNILTIEMIRRQAACWVKSDYNWNSSVTAMLYDLQWSTLSHHQEVSRLKCFTMPSTTILLSQSQTASRLPHMPHATSILYIL